MYIYIHIKVFLLYGSIIEKIPCEYVLIKVYLINNLSIIYIKSQSYPMIKVMSLDQKQSNLRLHSYILRLEIRLLIRNVIQINQTRNPVFNIQVILASRFRFNNMVTSFFIYNDDETKLRNRERTSCKIMYNARGRRNQPQ